MLPGLATRWWTMPHSWHCLQIQSRARLVGNCTHFTMRFPDKSSFCLSLSIISCVLLQATIWLAESVQNREECGDVWCHWRGTDPGNEAKRHTCSDTRLPKYTHTLMNLHLYFCVYRTIVCHSPWCIWTPLLIRSWQADWPISSPSIRYVL